MPGYRPERLLRGGWMGSKTSVYLADDIREALEADPRQLAEIIRAGLAASCERPRIVTSRAFCKALLDAGVISGDLDRIARVVIVAQPLECPRIYVEHLGDERIIDVASMLPGLDADRVPA